MKKLLATVLLPFFLVLSGCYEFGFAVNPLRFFFLVLGGKNPNTKAAMEMEIKVPQMALAQCAQLGSLGNGLQQYTTVDCNINFGVANSNDNTAQATDFSWQVPIRFQGNYTVDPTTPILLHMPDAYDNPTATFSDGINGNAIVTNRGACVAAGPSRYVCAEPGYKIVSLEYDSQTINQLAMGQPSGSFSLKMNLPSDNDFHLNAVFAVKVSQGNMDYFIPVLSNVNHMADAPRTDISPTNGTGTQLTFGFAPGAEYVNIADDGNFQLDSGVDGSWYDPNFDGQGWNIQLLADDLVLAYWFSYDASGNQAWFYGLGRMSGNSITFPNLRQPAGGRFGNNYDPAQVTQPGWGTLSMVFDDCDSGYIVYGGKSGFDTGEMNIRRITGLLDIPCGAGRKATPPARNKAVSGQMSGPWYDPTHDGEGWLLEIIDANTAVAYWFTYDSNGNQAWFTGVGTINGDQIDFPTLYRPTGGRFGMNSYNPSQVNRQIAGSMQFTFSNCSSGNMNYDLSAAGFGSGSLNLQKIVSIEGDGCNP